MINSSRYRILAIGKIRKRWINDGIDLYIKRLPGLVINELKDSNPKKESEDIKSLLRRNELLVALTEEGETLSSINFTKKLQEIEYQRIVFVIGGAEGLSPQIKALASWRFSLSLLTFPHDIARLLLIEQLYRAQSIANGTPYHRK